MNFKDHIHKNLDSGSHINKLTCPSAVTFTGKRWLIKTCVRPSSLLNRQKHFPVARNEQKLAHIFASSVNNRTKIVTLLQGYTGTVCYSLLTAQTYLTTSAFIRYIQRRNTDFSLQAFVEQEHAYILIFTLTTVLLVILLLQELNRFFSFPISMH